jgi:tripartite-type tricarboxylate transporter receptor subunit TctC
VRTSKIPRIALGALLALGLASPPAFAQTYPNKPVKIVAPFAPGGLVDVLARAVGDRLQKSLGQPFVVENRPGAGGNVGADLVARADPDGYTLLMSSAGILTINEFLYAKMPFDPATAFAPVTVVADMPMLLVVRKDLPARDIMEFIDLAKKTPGGLFFGSPGNGTTGHLGMELFMHATGLKLQHVPYKSAGDAVQAALAGQTATMFDNPPTVMAQIRAGGLRALGVAAKQRMPQLPDVPTISEAGVPGFEASSWFGVVVPAKTPRPVIDLLADEVAKALKDPEMQERFAKSGARLVGNTPDQFAALISADRARWEKVIRSAGIKLE